MGLVRWWKNRKLSRKRRRERLARAFERAVADGTGSDVRTATLAYLRTHRRWYVRWSRNYAWFWNFGTFSVIVFSTASSIIAAKPDLLFPADWSAKATVLLPAASALITAFLVQFRAREMWQLREVGRIATEDMICAAYAIPDDRDAALKSALEIRSSAHKLERDQMTGFFADLSKADK